MVKPKPRDLRARVLFKTSPTVRPSHWDLRLVVRLLEQVFPQGPVQIIDDWIMLTSDVGSDRFPIEIMAAKLSISKLRPIETDVLQIIDASIVLDEPSDRNEAVCLLPIEDGQLFDIYSNNAVLGRKFKVAVETMNNEGAED